MYIFQILLSSTLFCSAIYCNFQILLKHTSTSQHTLSCMNIHCFQSPYTLAKFETFSLEMYFSLDQHFINYGLGTTIDRNPQWTRRPGPTMDQDPQWTRIHNRPGPTIDRDPLWTVTHYGSGPTMDQDPQWTRTHNGP